MRALVTGAAGGIGSAIASSLEANGHSVARHDVRPAAGLSAVGDLLDPDALSEVEDLVDTEGVDCVVSAHGLSGAGALSTITEDEIFTIMRVNTLSVLRLYERVHARLRERDGVFVTVSSQAGLVGEAGNAVYSASKFALVGWARGVSRSPEAPRMRVVCPGMIDTPLLISALEQMAVDTGVSFDDVMKGRLESVPAGRLGAPREIGRAVTWLAELTTPACVVAAVTGGEVLF